MKTKRSSCLCAIVCALLMVVNVSAQEIIHQSEQDFSYYFHKSNEQHTAIFEIDSIVKKDFFKYYITLSINVLNQDSLFTFQVKNLKHSSDSEIKYRQFGISKTIFADCKKLKVSVFSGETMIKDITVYPNHNTLFLDTTLFLSLENKDISLRINEFEMEYGTFAKTKIKEFCKKVDNYYFCDTLFAHLNAKIDEIDTFLIDRFPLYKFTISDIEKEIQNIDNQKYETFLTQSGVDNNSFLLKRSLLFRRVEDLKIWINKKVANIDNLFFDKAFQLEKCQQIEDAIFYYNRVLDYNPQHCGAIERLNQIYTLSNRLNDNYLLWKKIITRGDSIDCKNKLITLVYDSLFAQTQYFIDNNNFYDALKILDTIDLFCKIIPVESCFSRLLLLKQNAQNGIYMSYYEVIGKAVRINELGLAKTYSYGLLYLMKQHGNTIEEQPNFQKLISQIVENHNNNIEKYLFYYRFENALHEIETVKSFMDSLNMQHIDYQKQYTIAHTNIYHQKLKKIHQTEKSGDKILLQKLKEDAENYKLTHYQYITENIVEEQIIPTEVVSKKIEVLDTFLLRKQFESLRINIHLADVEKNNFNLIDSFEVYYKIKTMLADTNETMLLNLVQKKLLPTLDNLLSKANQWAWLNEFEKAKQLLNIADNVFKVYATYFANENIVNKKKETILLIDKRMEDYLKEEFHLVEIKTQELEKQGQYAQAYKMLSKKQNELQAKNLYSQNIYLITKRIEAPARFQDSLQTVEILFNLQQWNQAFFTYTRLEEIYFLENIANFDIHYDSLSIYLQKQAKFEYLYNASIWFLSCNNQKQAMNMYFTMKSKGMLTEKVLNNLADSFLNITDSFEWLTEYSFDKNDKLFLEKLVDKKIYHLIMKKSTKKREIFDNE